MTSNNYWAYKNKLTTSTEESDKSNQETDIPSLEMHMNEMLKLDIDITHTRVERQMLSFQYVLKTP